MGSEHSMDGVFIKKLTELLEANLENEHFGVKELAETMGVSRSQLHRRLQTIEGKSTSRFIREFRLGKAMKMLQDNVATVAEIAYRVGFNSPTYFNTCFHNYYGYPPGEVKYRKPSEIGKGGKDRTSEQENSILLTDEKTEMGKKVIKRRTLLFASIFVVLLFASSYVYFTDLLKGNTTETVETKTREKSIAVLPFKNWSGDPELEYISDGMTDAVISRLAQIQSMDRVVPFTSMIKYKETDKSMPEIAKEVEVQYILQGNFQLSGNRLKINLQLIDGPANDHFWSDGYEGEWQSNDIFTVQTEVAENVAKNMNVMISDTDKEAIQKIPTNNKEAYALFLQANYQSGKHTKRGWENAVSLYESAIVIDPNFYEAYINEAYAWLMGSAIWGVFKEQESWVKIKELMNKATEISGMNSVIRDILLMGTLAHEWDFNTIEKEYMHSSLSIMYAIYTGRYKESLQIIDQYLETNPTNGALYAGKAQALFFLDRNREAIYILDSYVPLYIDDMDFLREGAKYYFYLEEYEKSKTLLNKMMTIFPDRPPIMLWLNAVHEQMNGNTELLKTYLDDLQKKYEDGSSGSPAWFIALYYCFVKDYENAFDWLQKSFDRHEMEMIWLREEPLLIPVRNDFRYLELYRNVGFPMEPHSTPE